MNIFTLWGEIEINRRKAETDIVAVEKQAGKSGKKMETSFDKVTKQIDGMIKKVDEFGKGVETFGKNISKKAGIPLAALTALMGGLAKTTADYTDAVDENAATVGMSSQAYQELTYAMQQSGLTQEDNLRMLGRVNQRLGFARQGNEKYRKSIEQMGLSLDDLDEGLIGTDEAFMAMIEHLHGMSDGQEQAALAGDFFGTMLSRRMMPMIRDGASSVDELRERAYDLGLVMDDVAVAKGALFNDTMDDLGFVTKGLGRIFGAELQAPLINIASYITDVMAGFSEWLRENPKLVRQIIIWGGAIAGVLGVLVTLGTTLVVTGKIIGALGKIFNILTSKPLLIIAAIGLLWLAWENDWGNIQTKTREVWGTIEPILVSLWDWFKKAWNWSIDIAGNAWAWLTETTWAEKWGTIKGWFFVPWQWTINTAGSVWDWLIETSWTEKIEDIRGWLGSAWAWTMNLAGKAWAWIDDNLPWLADAMRWIWEKLSHAWAWTVNAAGSAWAWFEGTKLYDKLKDLSELITDSKAWKWAVDTAIPFVADVGSAVLEITVKAIGDLYDGVKQGFATGDWSKFFDVSSNIWRAGVVIGVGLQLLATTGQAIMSAIGGLFGNVGGGLGVGGIPLAIGLLSVGIQLTEAFGKGTFDAFSKNILVAALVGAIGGAFFGPGGALMGFNLAINLKLGEVLEGASDSVMEAAGTPEGHMDLLRGYDDYVQGMRKEANFGFWDRFLGRKPEGMLDFEEWKKGAANTGRAFADGLESASDEVINSTENLAQEVADRLMGQSPPPKGPLADIDEGGYNVMEAWVEGAEEGLEDGAPVLASGLDKVKVLIASIWDKVPDEAKGPIEQAMGWVGGLIEQAEDALFKLDEFEEDLARIMGGGTNPEAEAGGFMARLAKTLDEKLESLDDPLTRFVDAVSGVALHLIEVVQLISAGDWKSAFLSILMETEAFAKGLELVGKLLEPFLNLVDAFLLPVIEFVAKTLAGVANFFIRAINGVIRILNKIPFVNIKEIKEVTFGGDPDTGGSGGGTGGRQVSEITGPTRDLLTDLMAPLANFGQIVAPIQDIRNILYERLPNFGNMDFAGAGVGAMGPVVVIETLNVSAPTTGVNDISRATIDQIEKALAGRINFGIRGRGDR